MKNYEKAIVRNIAPKLDLSDEQCIAIFEKATVEARQKVKSGQELGYFMAHSIASQKRVLAQ